MFINTKRINPNRGDTIVEVLIAIGIAAFAIGISYATANRSLHQAITARERNEALNVLQNQVADLKFRKQQTPVNSFNQFTFPTANHFCLDDTAKDPTATNWAPIANSPSITESTALQAADPPSASALYNTRCVSSGRYFVDITTQNSTATTSPTLYQVSVRWDQLDGDQLNSASVYYRF